MTLDEKELIDAHRFIAGLVQERDDYQRLSQEVIMELKAENEVLKAESKRLHILEEFHGYIATLPMRVEYLGGQRTSYVQRATVLDWLEVEIEKVIIR